MRTGLAIDERPGPGGAPRILFLPGLGARASGYDPLVRRLAGRVTAVLVDYPEGAAAGESPERLAERISKEIPGLSGVVASSYAGLVTGALVRSGVVRGAAFVGSFFRRAQLGWRGPLIPAMGAVAVGMMPGRLFASIASARVVPRADVPEIVPTTSVEQWSLWHRSWALRGWPDPPSLRENAGKFLVIQGGRDLLVPPRCADRVHADLPAGTTLYRIPEAGHVPYYTHPAEVADRLGPWLDALR